MISQDLRDKSLKIFFFTGVPLNDGATNFRAGLLARELTQRGHRIIFTSVSANYKSEKQITLDSLKVILVGQAHYFSGKPFSDRLRLPLGRAMVENFRTCFRVTRVLRQNKPDRVIVVTTMPVSLMVGLVAKLLGFKTYLDVEDLACGQMKSSGYNPVLIRLFGFVEALGVGIFDKVAVCSRFLGRRYRRSMIIPNMIRLPLWQKRASLNPGKAVNIVFVGEIGLYHGQAEVLKYLAPLIKEDKNLRLTFIGAGEKAATLKREAIGLRIGSQVKFTGRLSQPEVAKILNKSRIGVLPLWDKPVHQARHPLKLLEYLAASLVVVTNKVGEAGILIKDNVNGLVCPPGDIEAFSRKIKAVSGSFKRMDTMGRQAVLTAQSFSVEKILPRWMRFLDI